MAGKVIVINGPNLNLLGKREPDIYGTTALEEINAELRLLADEKGVEIDCFQSNHEGAIVDKIQSVQGKADYILINAGAYTHYSIAILDALQGVGIPFIEIHISNPESRESFRHTSLLSSAAKGKICGLGRLSYKLALLGVCDLLEEKMR